MSDQQGPPNRRAETLDTIRGVLSELIGASDSASAELDVAVALLELAQNLVVILDADHRIRYVNPHFESMTGHAMADIDMLDWFETCLPRDAVESTRLRFERAIAGDSTKGDISPLRGREDEQRIIEWHERVISGAEGRPAGLLAVGRDVTEREASLAAQRARNEELETRFAERSRELHDRNELLEGTFNASTVALAYLDRDMRFLRVNEAYAAADQKPPEYFVGMDHFELYPNSENQDIFYRVRDSGQAYTALAKPFQYAKNPERGTSHWDWTLTPVKDDRGQVSGLVLALRNVTERVKAIEAVAQSEARLQEELAEKNVLLREIHHRVKNNLQMVSSLLFLQAKNETDDTFVRPLAESRSRVQAMALVHETLYSSGDFSRVDFDTYLHNLVVAMHSSYSDASKDIEFVVDATEPSLDLDTAMTCGLIVCELVTNALKYAFEGRQRGCVRVSLRPTRDDRLCLEVVDDGVGIGAIDQLPTTTLGLTLVRTMSSQLDGELSMADESGTAVRVVFPPP